MVVTDDRGDDQSPFEVEFAICEPTNDRSRWRIVASTLPGRIGEASMSVFDELRAHASLPFEQARMLPLEAYASAEVLDAELATLFAHWQCVARTADLGDVGDYVFDLPVTGGGVRPIVVIRGEDSIRAFDNVCIHRGAQLLTGCGNETRITCPYHAWVYRHDGSLVGGPYMAEALRSTVRPSVLIAIVCPRYGSNCGTASCSSTSTPMPRRSAPSRRPRRHCQPV